MKHLTFRSVTAVGALVVAGIAGFAVQSADANRLDAPPQDVLAQMDTQNDAPAGISAPPSAAGTDSAPAEAPAAEEAAPAAGSMPAPSAAAPAATVPLAGQGNDVRVVPLRKDVTEVSAPPATEEQKKANVTVSPSASPVVVGGESKRQNMNVHLDMATVIRMPKETSTIVVGNPVIADTTVQNNGMIVITGKSHGTTNIMVLNTTGDLIKEYMVTVVGSNPSVALTVQRGMDRETWSCAPNCQRTITLGDGGEYFSSVAGQASSRNGASQGGSGPGR